jgi:putative membrane protein
MTVAESNEGTVSRLPDQTTLAIERTRLAYERTLLAWVRTAVALISFGFTVYKLFQYLHDNNPAPPARLVGPREFGLALIGVGLLALVFAIIEHRHNVKTLGTSSSARRSLAGIFAAFVAGLGVLGFLVVVFQE